MTVASKPRVVEEIALRARCDRQVLLRSLREGEAREARALGGGQVDPDAGTERHLVEAGRGELAGVIDAVGAVERGVGPGREREDGQVAFARAARAVEVRQAEGDDALVGVPVAGRRGVGSVRAELHHAEGQGGARIGRPALAARNGIGRVAVVGADEDVHQRHFALGAGTGRDGRRIVPRGRRARAAAGEQQQSGWQQRPARDPRGRHRAAGYATFKPRAIRRPGAGASARARTRPGRGS